MLDTLQHVGYTYNMSNTPLFDFRAFLDANWRSSGHVVEFLGAYGLPERTANVLKWRERKSIPAQRFAVLVALQEIDRGTPISLAPYITQ